MAFNVALLYFVFLFPFFLFLYHQIHFVYFVVHPLNLQEFICAVRDVDLKQAICDRLKLALEMHADIGMLCAVSIVSGGGYDEYDEYEVFDARLRLVDLRY